MNTGKIKKAKFIICIILLFNSVSLIVNADSHKVYETYVDEMLVGYTDNKKEFRNIYKEVKEYLNNRIGYHVIDNKKIKFKNTDIKTEISSKEQLRNNIKKTINTEIDAKVISINNKNYGVIVNQDEANDVIENFINNYLKKFNTDIDNIIEVNINGDIKYLDTRIPVSNISDINEVLENINNDNNIKDNINVEVKVKEDKEVNIQPKTKIQRDESMYIGENKVIEGEAGSKHVTSEVLYCNGNKVNEDIISEDIIKQPKDRIEYRGTKTLIGTNIAFLKAPTRGGAITSKFGVRWGRNHNGIDIAGNTGDPVTAAYDGIVEEAASVSGYGNMIKIKHEDNIETIYGHLSLIKATKGQQVKKGDIIGEVGNTGRSTGPHLHFELRSKGNPINPEGYILNN